MQALVPNSGTLTPSPIDSMGAAVGLPDSSPLLTIQRPLSITLGVITVMLGPAFMGLCPPCSAAGESAKSPPLRCCSTAPRRLVRCRMDAMPGPNTRRGAGLATTGAQQLAERRWRSPTAWVSAHRCLGRSGLPTADGRELVDSQTPTSPQHLRRTYDDHRWPPAPNRAVGHRDRRSAWTELRLRHLHLTRQRAPSATTMGKQSERWSTEE